MRSRCRPAEQGRRMRSLRRRVLEHDVEAWSQRRSSSRARRRCHRPGEVDPHEHDALTRRPTDGAARALAATPRLLVALDFDGTLAPLDRRAHGRACAAGGRARRSRASRRCPTRSSPSSRGAACTICARSPSTPTTRRIYLAGLARRGVLVSPARATLGATGRTTDDGDALRDGAARRDAAQPRSSTRLEGVWIEPKTFGFGVHTRVGTRRRRRAAATPPRSTHSWPSGPRTGVGAPGTDIVEFSFRHEGKDSAIAALRERLGATACCSPATT